MMIIRINELAAVFGTIMDFETKAETFNFKNGFNGRMESKSNDDGYNLFSLIIIQN
jgi:hypothetical protein